MLGAGRQHVQVAVELGHELTGCVLVGGERRGDLGAEHDVHEVTDDIRVGNARVHLAGRARFSIVWTLEEGRWRAGRALSIDHAAASE